MILGKHQLAVRAMLIESGFEFDEEVFRNFGGMSTAPQERNEFTLPNDVLLPEGDVIVHHSEIGRGKGHGAV